MWRSTVLILSVMTGTFASQKCFLTLGFLSNLRVTNVTYRSAFLSWDFRQAEDVPLNEVEFSLTLSDPEKSMPTTQTHLISETFEFAAENLTPGTKYLVKLVASLSNDQICRTASRTLFTSFRTSHRGAFTKPDEYPLQRQERSTRITETSPPGSRLEFFAVQQDHDIVLDYNFPRATTGPLHYFDVFICEGCNLAESPESNKNTLVHGLRLRGHRFLFTPRLRGGKYSPAEQIRRFLFGNWRPAYPISFVVMEDQSIVKHFGIAIHFPEKSEKATGDPQERLFLRLGRGIADVFRMEAYKYISYRIRRCMTYQGGYTDTCGRSSSFRVLSDVGAPSRVTNVRARSEMNSLYVYWGLPAKPNGPVDGYEITMRVWNRYITTRVRAPVQFHSLTPYDPRTVYTFEIRAYNVDLRDKNVMHWGAWTFKEISGPIEMFQQRNGTIYGAIIGIILGVLFVFCFCRHLQTQTPAVVDYEADGQHY